MIAPASASRYAGMMTFRSNLRAICPVLGCASVLCWLAAGCASITRFTGGAPNSITAASVDGASVFSPMFTTAVYRPVDPQTAEIFLTDLPISRLSDSKDRLGDAAGSIVHVHLFLVPSAGNTPIDITACNVTIRHVLLAGKPKGIAASDTPAMGLYAGAGFVQPSDTIGEDRIDGSLTGASHRIVRSSAGFADLIGTGTLSGTFGAVRDDALARTLAGRMETLIREMTPVADEKNSAGAGSGAGTGGVAGRAGTGGARAGKKTSEPRLLDGR